MKVVNGLRLALDREDYVVQKQLSGYYNIVTFPYGTGVTIKSHMTSEAECEEYIFNKINVRELPLEVMSGHCTCGIADWVFATTLEMIFEYCIHCNKALRPSVVTKINAEVLKDFDLEDIFGD